MWILSNQIKIFYKSITKSRSRAFMVNHMKKIERPTSPGPVIHADVCEPFVKSSSDFKYFELFKDYYTKYKFIFFRKHKSEVYEKVIAVLKEWTQATYKMKALMSDNGTEFDNIKLNCCSSG